MEERHTLVHGEPLSPEESRKYLSVGALLNFVTADRPELLYAIKEVLRASSRPGTEDLRRLKRILRFIKGVPRLAINMPWESERKVVTISVDADFAGCRETRKSTMGGCIHYGNCLLKAWSKTILTTN